MSDLIETMLLRDREERRKMEERIGALVLMAATGRGDAENALQESRAAIDLLRREQNR